MQHVIIGVETGTKVVTRYEQSTQQLADVLLSVSIEEELALMIE